MSGSADVLIIGGGPAGLSTAMHLHALTPAIKAIVLEKAHHPRPKLCGGGVSIFGAAAWRALGLPWPPPVPHVPVGTVRFSYHHDIVTLRHPEAVFTVFPRVALDAYLAHQARQRGVTLHEGVTVHRLRRRSNDWDVLTSAGTYHARIVVAADGSRGTTRNLVVDRKHSATARLLESITPSNGQWVQARQAVFDFSAVSEGLQGYTWTFPLDDGARPACNQGVYDARIARQAPKARLPTLMQSTFPHSRPPQGHPIHLFSPFQRFARPGILLVGDAAGADPLFGEGIGPALAYGQIAAQTIAAAFRRHDFRLRDYRRRVLTSPLGRYLTLRWAVAWLGYRLAPHRVPMAVIWRIAHTLAFFANISSASPR